MQVGRNGSGPPAGIVLAAGGGSRFGRPKAGLTLGGRTFVERAVDALTDGGCGPVLVVLGAAEVDVPAPAVAVRNPRWAAGIGTSLAVGLDAAAEASAAVVTLVDLPLLRPAAVRAVLDAAAGGAAAAVARYGGRPGHPVLLARRIWPAVLAAAGQEHGAGRWLRAHPDLVAGVDCDGLGGDRDVDTPADLADLAGY